MPSARSATASTVRTEPGSENEWLSRARGLNVLRWIGLVREPLPAQPDELAHWSLTTDQPVDDPAHWIF